MEDKNKYVAVWLKILPNEKIKIKQNAKQADMTVSRYVMHLVENHPIFVIQDMSQFAVQLKKLGTNINQLAKIANEQKFLDVNTKRVLKDTQKELEGMAQSVNGILRTVNIYRNTTGQEFNMDSIELEQYLQKALMLVKSRKYNGNCEKHEEEN